MQVWRRPDAPKLNADKDSLSALVLLFFPALYIMADHDQCAHPQFSSRSTLMTTHSLARAPSSERSASHRCVSRVDLAQHSC